MPTPLFELREIRFRDVLQVDRLSIPSGKTTCIIGASGSGKSTLLRMLNRMITPDSGDVEYLGTNLDSINHVELRRRVVMLPQNPVMFEGNVRDNVLKGCEFSGRELVDDARIQRVLEIVLLDKELDARPARMSGGERQRLAIARVLAMQPEVLLLDEPSSALDSVTQDEVIANLMIECKAMGTDVVIVTHASDIAEQWGEQIIEINAGQVARIRQGAAHG